MPSTFDFSDVPPPPFSEEEPHFRRGYHHGVTMMLRAMQNGASIQDLERFINGPVMDWRNGSEPAYPPEFHQAHGTSSDPA